LLPPSSHNYRAISDNAIRIIAEWPVIGCLFTGLDVVLSAVPLDGWFVTHSHSIALAILFVFVSHLLILLLVLVTSVCMPVRRLLSEMFAKIVRGHQAARKSKLFYLPWDPRCN
jgi:hypothetical protein